MVEQLCEYTEKYWAAHFKRVTTVVCESYLSKAVKKGDTMKVFRNIPQATMKKIENRETKGRVMASWRAWACNPLGRWWSLH